MFHAGVQISDQDIRTISAEQNGAHLGTVGVTKDGRVYRYAKAGSTELDPGKLTVNADLVANHTNRTVAAAVSTGSLEVGVSIGGTAATENQYAGGYLTINDAAGEGIRYLIAGNRKAAGSDTLSVYLAEPVKVALTTSSEATLKLNNFSGTVISATDQADLPVGVPNVTVTASYFYWSQTGGECSVLADEAVTKGLEVTIGTGVAGAVEAVDAVAEVKVGTASEALVDTEYRNVNLSIC